MRIRGRCPPGGGNRLTIEAKYTWASADLRDGVLVDDVHVVDATVERSREQQPKWDRRLRQRRSIEWDDDSVDHSPFLSGSFSKYQIDPVLLPGSWSRDPATEDSATVLNRHRPRDYDPLARRGDETITIHVNAGCHVGLSRGAGHRYALNTATSFAVCEESRAFYVQMSSPGDTMCPHYILQLLDCGARRS